jgi:hypothetical protein
MFGYDGPSKLFALYSAGVVCLDLFDISFKVVHFLALDFWHRSFWNASGVFTMRWWRLKR